MAFYTDSKGAMVEAYRVPVNSSQAHQEFWGFLASLPHGGRYHPHDGSVSVRDPINGFIVAFKGDWLVRFTKTLAVCAYRDKTFRATFTEMDDA